MKAALFHKIGDISVGNVPDPIIEQPGDDFLSHRLKHDTK